VAAAQIAHSLLDQAKLKTLLCTDGHRGAAWARLAAIALQPLKSLGRTRLGALRLRQFARVGSSQPLDCPSLRNQRFKGLLSAVYLSVEHLPTLSAGLAALPKTAQLAPARR